MRLQQHRVSITQESVIIDFDLTDTVPFVQFITDTSSESSVLQQIETTFLRDSKSTLFKGVLLKTQNREGIISLIHHK